MLYYNRFIILFTQICTLKTNTKIGKTFFNLMVQHLEKYSSTYNSWPTGAGIK